MIFRKMKMSIREEIADLLNENGSELKD